MTYVPKEPSVDTKGSSTEGYGIGTHHKGRQTHGTGQNHRAGPTKLLVAGDEPMNHRLR